MKSINEFLVKKHVKAPKPFKDLVKGDKIYAYNAFDKSITEYTVYSLKKEIPDMYFGLIYEYDGQIKELKENDTCLLITNNIGTLHLPAECENLSYHKIIKRNKKDILCVWSTDKEDIENYI